MDQTIAEEVSRVANATYGHSRRIMTEQPWWKNLDPVFHKFPDDFYLDLRTQVVVGCLAALDVLTRTGFALLATVFAFFSTLRRIRLDDNERGFYRAVADRANVDEVFPRPEGIPEVSRRPDRARNAPAGAIVERLGFRSGYRALNPALQEKFDTLTRNQTVSAQYWRHGDGPRPTLVVVHGFILDSYAINSRFLHLADFFREGYDIVLCTLPFHGSRRERWAPYSGHGVFSYGVCHLNETIRQGVQDIRLLLNWLEGEGVEKIGATGISLGGYTTALLAATEERLHFCIPIVPVASLTDVIFEWAPAGPLIRIGMRLANISIPEARHVMALQSPLTWTPKLPRERLMIVGGAGDRVVPPKHARLLWDHWERPRLHWFPGNHLIHLDQGVYLQDMRTFIRGTGFADSRRENRPAG
jgi:pimeloyl-ACP methyl ester carboxylesterase